MADDLPPTLPPPPIPADPSLRDVYEIVALVRASLETFEGRMLARVEALASDIAGAKNDIKTLRHTQWQTAQQVDALTKRVEALEGGELSEPLKQLVAALQNLVPPARDPLPEP